MATQSHIIERPLCIYCTCMSIYSQLMLRLFIPIDFFIVRKRFSTHISDRIRFQKKKRIVLLKSYKKRYLIKSYLNSLNKSCINFQKSSLNFVQKINWVWIANKIMMTQPYTIATFLCLGPDIHFFYVLWWKKHI